jgi:hypothetical protein
MTARGRTESKAERRARIAQMSDAERYSDENFAFALTWLGTKYRGGEEAVATLLEYYIRTYGEPLAIEQRKALWVKAIARCLYGPEPRS